MPRGSDRSPTSTSSGRFGSDCRTGIRGHSGFLRETRDLDDWSEAHEPGFKDRLPWLPYLGATSLEDAQRRQKFFFGYANVLTTTNAYRNAGAQSFASVIQNTRVEDVQAYLRRWASGESPQTTRFPTFGNVDETPKDRADYAAIIGALWLP